MNVFVPKWNILPTPQKTLWPELAFAKDIGFTLYGGTAIALRLGHRASVDFDFFSAAPVDKHHILTKTKLLENGQVIQDADDTLTIVTERAGGTVKVSFFGDLFPKRLAGRVDEPEMTEDGVLRVASLDDLFATKVKVVLDRAEAKDYLDIVALLKAGKSLDHALGAAVAIYGPAYQPSESLKALSYFGDGDLHTLSKANQNFLTAAAAREHTLPKVTVLTTPIPRENDNDRNGGR